MKTKNKDYVMDFGFYSIEIKVKAKNKTEARKKAMAKLKKKQATSFINKTTTFIDEI